MRSQCIHMKLEKNIVMDTASHEKINRCLTDIENQFYKISVISVKCRFTQISTLMIFSQYLTDTNRYILETHIISKIG